MNSLVLVHSITSPSMYIFTNERWWRMLRAYNATSLSLMSPLPFFLLLYRSVFSPRDISNANLS